MNLPKQAKSAPESLPESLPKSLLQSVSVSRLAQLLNLTARRIQQLSEIGVIPKNKRGRYDLENSIQAYVAYLQDRAAGRATDHTTDPTSESANNADYYQERTRLTQLQADEKAILLEQRRGNLLPINAVADTWGKMISQARAKLLSLPNKMAAPISALQTTDTQSTGICRTAAIEALLKTAINEALTELANPYPEDAADPTPASPTTDQPNLVTATDAHRQSVGGSLSALKS